ncbi:hypothetical protein IB655_03660 [Francisella noatunensis]|uniref:Uncharacterized protein n=1 Tax=Francisella noatunensis TaxID=657445 RepID=A0A9Q2KSD1_9GAMM|nr:hypothetical protein [Francisella noatunensis]MBK2029187.1 hypothetical protein [Francisella noatunensis]MBK2034057.1 hypothetical protein [Francisella noatunensis]MBK2048972.1 hypothetical protein [Francisella noatunensis]MBK2050781.1 hypothetical protein [Francisella noatunensis]MBK2051458.1 hypothetical protein [Francisella noatunensis]
MSKKSIKDMLSLSIKDEQDTVTSKLSNFNNKADKFDKAEAFFNEEEKNTDDKNKSSTVVKDLFSFPQNDYEIINKSIDRALENRIIMNKSEVVRAALKVLIDLDNDEFVKAIQSVEKIKRGRK